MSSDTFDTIDKYVDQGEKNKAHDEKEKGGSDRLQDSIHRLKPKDQSLNEMYDPPANFLEIDVCKPFTHTDEHGKRFTDYEIHMRTNLPVFAIKEFTVRRRYSDFVWLRKEIERTVKIYIPELPGKAFGKQLSILAKDDGIFEPDFIEERRQGLEEFINSVAGHPLVQNEKCLHSFLQEKNLDKEGYVPGKIGQ